MLASATQIETSINRLQKSSRSGVAAVEFAVCLPMLVALVFGAIEASNAVFLQQALTASAYEAGNVASSSGGTSADALVRAKSVLSGLRVNSATISISPTVTIDTPIGTTIVITCSAPLSANSATSWCLNNKTMTAKYTIPRL
jgi:Flp pilus assembly protein TadG